MDARVLAALVPLAMATHAAAQTQPPAGTPGGPGKPGLIFRHVALTGAPAAQSHAWQALGALFDDQLDVARREAGEALRSQPDMAVAHVLLAGIAKKAEERKQHIEAASRGQKLSAWEKAWIQAASLEHGGKSALALKQYDALVKAAPTEPWFYVMRGIALMKTGSLPAVEKARADFEKAVSMWPGCRAGWKHLGHALAALGKVKEALNAVNRYVEIAPNLPTPHDTMGEVLLRVRQPKEAEAEYRTALRLDPGYHASRIGLGYALVNRGLIESGGRRGVASSPQAAQGVQELEMAVAKTTEPAVKARAAEVLAVSHLLLGKPGQAVGVIERYEQWAKSHGDPEILAGAQLFSALVHAVLGVYRHSHVKAEEALATAQDPRVSPAVRQRVEVFRTAVKSIVLFELGEPQAAEARLKDLAKTAGVAEWVRQVVTDLRGAQTFARGEAKKAVSLLADATEERPVALYYLAKAQLKAQESAGRTTLERLASATSLDPWVALWRYAALETLRALQATPGTDAP